MTTLVLGSRQVDMHLPLHGTLGNIQGRSYIQILAYHNFK